MSSFNFPATGAHVPEDKDQQLVVTPYGKGLVVRTRKHVDGVQEIELIDWKGATNSGPNRPATLFTSTKFPSAPPAIGDDVLTVYGRGKVLEIRNNHQAVVLLSSWRLAGRSRVKCYLSLSSLRVVRAKKLYEMNVYEKVEHGQELKSEATAFFQRKEYEKALNVYSHAVDAVRYVQHKRDSSNEVRADLLVLMITCSNNAGTCCTQLQKWDDSIKFAKSALSLIEALEEKKGKRIHTFLNQEGFSDIKIFGDWKVKSYLITARSLSEKGDSAEAMDVLKTAQDVILSFTASIPEGDPSLKQLLVNGKEVKKLYATCKDQRKAQLQKEKQRAQAMFAKPARDEGETKDGKKDFRATVSHDNGQAVQPPLDTAPISPRASPSASAAAQQSPNKPKKNVSFAENLTQTPEIEWYEDAEVLTGLAIFAGAVVATAAGLTYFLSRKS
jgi:tetratricopeptide (TPR) repeat protein